MSLRGKGYTDSAAFDVSEYLPPLHKETVFGNSKPLTLDIGCGNGEFLFELSRLMPNFNHLGVEIKAGRFGKAVKTAKQSGTGNLKFVHMDCILAARLFAAETFDRIYINFPDPWPKDRHRKHRIINRDFISLLGFVAKTGGRLEIASDHDEYMTLAAETLDGSNEFRNLCAGTPLLSYPKGRPPTRFEKIFRKQGEEIKYLIYEAKGD